LGPWATANYCRAVTKSLRGTDRQYGNSFSASII
jgi:hypothetical protein